MAGRFSDCEHWEHLPPYRLLTAGSGVDCECGQPQISMGHANCPKRADHTVRNGAKLSGASGQPPIIGKLTNNLEKF